MADLTVKRWKKLGEFLILKYMDGIVKNEFFKPINVGYPDDFKKLMVEKDGPSIKMKKLDIELEEEYKTNIKNAEKYIADKNYVKAKSELQKALNIKSDDKDAKLKLEKVEKILSDIEAIHNQTFSN
jgi:hypothetical protein